MFSFMNGPDQRDYIDVCSSVVPGILYVSGHRPANNLRILQELNIQHIVRLGDKEDLELYVDHPEITYHTIEIEDSLRSHMTPDILDDAIAFIKSSTTPVLVHCYAGVSRSVSICMAYLMKVNGMNYQDSKKFLKEKRPCASPNTTFLKDLHVYWGMN